MWFSFVGPPYIFKLCGLWLTTFKTLRYCWWQFECRIIYWIVLGGTVKKFLRKVVSYADMQRVLYQESFTYNFLQGKVQTSFLPKSAYFIWNQVFQDGQSKQATFALWLLRLRRKAISGVLAKQNKRLCKSRLPALTRLFTDNVISVLTKRKGKSIRG